MKFGRLFCGITAAAIAMGSATAYAAGENAHPKLELVTVPLCEIHNADGLFPLGRGIFGYNITGTEVDNDIDGFVYIDEEKFAETGILSYTDITVEGFDVNSDSLEGCGYFTDTMFDNGDYITLYTFDESGTQTSRFAVKYDAENGTISKFRDLKNENGQIISCTGMSCTTKVDMENETYTVTVTKADGTTFENIFSGTQFHRDEYNPYGAYYMRRTPRSDKYCYGITFKTEYHSGESTSNSESDIYASNVKGSTGGSSMKLGTYTYESYVVDNSGNAIKVDEGTLNEFARSPGVFSVNDDIMCNFYTSMVAGGFSLAFVSVDSSMKRYYCIPNQDSSSYNHAIMNPDIEPLEALSGSDLANVEGIYGDIFFAKLTNDNYVLFDYKNNDVVLVEDYTSMMTADNGKTFLVQTGDGKWGYIDAKGNELGVFDDAASFIGDYAPVVENGKARLIDRNMNTVSESISSSGGHTISDKLAVMIVDNEEFLMTYRTSSVSTKADYTDEDTDITVTVSENAFEENVSLVVTPIPADTTEDKYAYDIKFINDGGEEVQPNGEVTVKLPIPETLNGKTIYVFRAENERFTDMNAEAVDGYAVFTTDHFSEYVLTSQNLNDTGSSGSSGSAGNSNTSGTSESTVSSETSSEPASSENTGYTESESSVIKPVSSESAPSVSGNPPTGIAAVSAIPAAALICAAAFIVKKKK